jgi:TPR repeat protein
MLLRAIVFIIAVLLLHPARAEEKVALLIGNAEYSTAVSTLRNPPNDVSALRGVLEQAGFDVHVVENAGRVAMSRALADFSEVASRADIGLIYYSGHGIEMNGENYLVPVDAALASDLDVEYETVALRKLLDTLSGVRKFKLVLLDACRDNPLFQKMKRPLTRGSASRGLARIDSAESNMLIGFATAPGEVALDGDGVNSPYASALARHLVTPSLEVESALRAVAKDVYEATAGKQRPYITGSLFETVMLGPETREAVETVTPTPTETQSGIDPCRDAATHWSAISERKDRTLLEEHVRLFPGCAFTSLAKLEIAALQPPALVEPETKREILPEPVVENVTQNAAETACDRLAADPYDAAKIASVSGIDLHKMNISVALTACQKAIREFPDEMRFRYQLGRAHHARSIYLQALENYRVAADKGYAAAMSGVGLLYEMGRGGVPQDYNEAGAWFEKADKAGDLTAMHNLVSMFDNSLAAARNRKEAARYAEGALRRGDAYFLTQMKEVSGRYSPELRKSIQQRLKDAGAFRGKIDGHFGPDTIEAIEAIFGKG